MALASCPMSRNVLLSRNTGLHVHPSSPTPLLPRFHSGFAFQGVIQTLEQLPTKRAEYFYTCCHKAYATTVTDTPVNDLPTWAEFEMGKFPVFWKTSNGRPPASGESLTIFFNSAASSLVPNSEFGIAFNGGFNQPIMCGGQPRIMTKRDRGTKCDPLYTIKINVPLHALTLEFSFYDGKNWDGPYKLQFQRPAKWKNMPPTFFNKGLAEELSREGACESAIYPDAAYVQDRCSFPASLIHEAGKSCELDIVPGCTDQDSPFFNPLATVDDGSCSFNPDEFSEEEHV